MSVSIKQVIVQLRGNYGSRRTLELRWNATLMYSFNLKGWPLVVGNYIVFR